MYVYYVVHAASEIVSVACVIDYHRANAIFHYCIGVFGEIVSDFKFICDALSNVCEHHVVDGLH